jgi:hypothetical protein
MMSNFRVYIAMALTVRFDFQNLEFGYI